ncbi:hypothetical protein B7494_g5423 [Chlorociboria aeruginascens]|nr:hypothetical protein B7494_g5423 [Chlorociboria aeruginascens]
MSTVALPSKREPPPSPPAKLILYPTPSCSLEAVVINDLNELPDKASGKAIFRFDNASGHEAYYYDGVYHLPTSTMESRLQFFACRYVTELAKQIASTSGYHVDIRKRAKKLSDYYHWLEPLRGSYTEDDLYPLLSMLSKSNMQSRPTPLEDIDNLDSICEILGNPDLLKQRCLWNSILHFHTGLTIEEIMRSVWHRNKYIGTISTPLIMATTKQRLALSIIDFLNTSLSDGTLSADDRESIEVATSCISDTFKVDPTDATPKDTQSLLQIYSVYATLKHKPTTPASASAAATETTTNTPSNAQKAEAEALKSRGNAAMAKKDYLSAISLYSEALALVPGNPIFLSNRAAAYSASKDHESARADAEAAVASDPKYTKAWSRLGLARFALGDAKGSMEAYSQGIEHEGNGGSDAMKKGFETAKKRVAELEAEGGDVDDDGEVADRGASTGAGGMPDLSSLASMFGGGGAGGAGGGGMPDLSSIMSNPMFANMAQNLMSNPDMMSNLMNNPRIREMANQFGVGGAGGAGGAGGMPDFSTLMQDPTIADLASKLGGPGAGRGRGTPPS